VTVSQKDRGSLPRVVVQVPEVDDYSGDAWCPMCNHPLETVSTPDVPMHLLKDDLGGERRTVSVYGHQCDRHRVDRVVLPLPATFAPETYCAVDATIDGEAISVAVPQVLLQEVDDAE